MSGVNYVRNWKILSVAPLY